MKMGIIGGVIFLLSSTTLALQTTMNEDVVSMSWIIGGMATGIVMMGGFIAKLVMTINSLHKDYGTRMQDIIKENAGKNEQVIKEVTNAMNNQATATNAAAKATESLEKFMLNKYGSN
jgi:hypothetical protein